MTSPTFVAKFRDGTVTRMTTHCAPDNLDVLRGIILSRAAYQSRMKGKRPPPIVEARFQTSEAGVLCEYDAEAITRRALASDLRERGLLSDDDGVVIA